MSDIKEFIAAPSQEFLDACTKEQLLLIAEHYSVVATIRSNFIEFGLMAENKRESPPSPSALSVPMQE